MNRVFNEDNLVKLDSVLTFVPVLSTIVCTVNIIAKAVFVPFILPDTIDNHPYLRHLKRKDYSVCAWGLIPIIGNVALIIILCRSIMSTDLSAALQDLGPVSAEEEEQNYQREIRKRLIQEEQRQAEQRIQELKAKQALMETETQQAVEREQARIEQESAKQQRLILEKSKQIIAKAERDREVLLAEKQSRHAQAAHQRDQRDEDLEAVLQDKLHKMQQDAAELEKTLENNKQSVLTYIKGFSDHFQAQLSRNSK